LLSWSIVAGSALSLALAQLLCHGLARGLGLRLRLRDIATALCLSATLWVVWASQDRLLAPVDGPISRQLPDAPSVSDPDRHGLNDAVLLFLPWEMEVRRAMCSFRLPLWSDVLEGGSSPWINPQAGALAPASLLTRHIPIEHWLLVAFAVKLVIAYHGASLLARALGARATASGIAGLGLALGPLTPWAVFPPLSNVIAFMPWLVLGTLRVARSGSGKVLATTGVIFAALLLSGHPETALASSLLAATVGISFARRNERPRALARSAAAALLGATLAAVQFVPFLVALPRTHRVARVAERQATAAESDPEGKTNEAASSHSILLRPLHPWAFGRPFHEPNRGPAPWPAQGAGYPGLLATAGTALALSSRRARRRALPFVGFAVLALALVSATPPGPSWWSRLPLASAYVPNRLLSAAALALIVAGALGIEAVSRQKKPLLSGWIAIAVTGCASLAILANALALATWGLVAVALALGQRRRRWASALLVLAALVDLVPWAYDHLPRGHRELFYPRTATIRSIQRAQGVTGTQRVVGAGRLLYPSLLPMYGIADIRPQNPMAPADQLAVLETALGFRPESETYKGAIRRPAHPLLDFLSVKVIVTSDRGPRLRRYKLVSRRASAGMRVYRNPHSLPIVFLPTAIDLVPPAGLLARLRDVTDARRVAVSEPAAGLRGFGEEAPWDPNAVEILTANPGSMDLRVARTGPRLLASSLPGPAGWEARGGSGSRLRTVVVNGAFLGVVVPDGIERVALRYRPPGFVLGCWLSLAGVLAAGALGMRRTA
jgi:hypothetical protein